jgi:F0F1-type ATP synthase membrane subunit b/b'
LGFIYTLASLSAALLQLRGGARIEELLGSFGIALFTTIVGVAGRVLFVQMRGDIDEVEDEVRKDLLSASADLRAQLSITLGEFETFHTGVQQATRKAAEQSTTAAQDAISNISRVVNAAAENIDKAFARESDRLHSFEQAVLRIENGLKNLTTEMSDRVYELSDSLERMVGQLAIAIDLISRRRSKLRFWPFGRK